MSAPTREDPLVATLSEVVGGPLGDHAAPRAPRTAARVQVALTAGALLVGLAIPGGSVHPARVAGSALLALLVTWLLVSVSAEPVPGRRGLRWSAAAWALGPVLALHWQSWSLVAAAGVALALWGATRSGAWLLATALGAGVSGWMLWDRLATSRPDLGSTWLLVEQVSGVSIRPAWWLVVAVAAVGVAAAAAYVGWRRSVHRDVVTLARVVLVVLATVVLVLPSAPPATALLLLPLAAVAVRRWADLLFWQGCELASWVITGWFLDDLLAPAGGGTEKAYWVAILLRVIGVAWLVLAALGRTPGSADDDAVEGRGGEADPHLDLLADTGDPRT